MSKRTTNHLQVKAGPKGIEVDEKLVPFLELLWEHGIDTMMSCQDNPRGSGRVWINFSSPKDATDFLRIAVPQPTVDFEPHSLYNRVYVHWFPNEWPRGSEIAYQKSRIDEELWGWRCSLMDLTFCEEKFTDKVCWPNFDISARFPFTDIEQLTKNIKAGELKNEFDCYGCIPRSRPRAKSRPLRKCHARKN